jgi:carboxypeptidase T
MKGRICSTFLILVFFIGLLAIQEPKALTEQPVLVKIHIKNQNDLEEIVAMGFDVIEVKPSFVKVLALHEQILLLEKSGLKVEYLPLSEIVDESAVSKADAGLYHTYAEAVAELHQIEASHGNIAKLFVIGKSIQGRDIFAIKVSDNPAVEEAEEPEVLYMGCHHAREWISVEIPMYLVNYLVSNYGVNPAITRLVDERETWIVPIVNPDGLEYSQKVYTMWRKNMRDNNNNLIFERSYDGVDLNRNYGYKWGHDDIGSSPYPWDETYRGKSAFSEPETQAVANLTLMHDFVFSISYHSYGEVMVYPWGYANLDTVDDKLFTDVASRMSRFNGYAYGNAKDGAMYNTNGDATDWQYAYSGTLAYTFELGTAFIPPEKQIEQIWLRNRYASLYLIYIADNPRQIYPAIKVYTDKTEYSQGDEMKVGLQLTNPENAMAVGIGIWVDLPSGEKYWVAQEPYVNVPENFNYTNAAWKSYVLPSLQLGSYSWHAMVVDAFTAYVLSESKASWEFKTGG